MEIPHFLTTLQNVWILIIIVLVWAAKMIMEIVMKVWEQRRANVLVDNLIQQTVILQSLRTSTERQTEKLTEIGISLATAQSLRHTATSEEHNQGQIINALGTVCKFVPKQSHQ